jgi:hypothetical protein
VVHLENLRDLGETLRGLNPTGPVVRAYEHERDETQTRGVRVDPRVAALSTPLSSSLRIRSKTADGARPTCLEISAFEVRAFLCRIVRICLSRPLIILN